MEQIKKTLQVGGIISFSSKKYLSKELHRIVKVVACICHSSCKYLSKTKKIVEGGATKQNSASSEGAACLSVKPVLRARPLRLAVCSCKWKYHFISLEFNTIDTLRIARSLQHM